MHTFEESVADLHVTYRLLLKCDFHSVLDYIWICFYFDRWVFQCFSGRMTPPALSGWSWVIDEAVSLTPSPLPPGVKDGVSWRARGGDRGSRDAAGIRGDGWRTETQPQSAELCSSLGEMERKREVNSSSSNRGRPQLKLRIFKEGS